MANDLGSFKNLCDLVSVEPGQVFDPSIAPDLYPLFFPSDFSNIRDRYAGLLQRTDHLSAVVGFDHDEEAAGGD